jgi:hypothetical protein
MNLGENRIEMRIPRSWPCATARRRSSLRGDRRRSALGVRCVPRPPRCGVLSSSARGETNPCNAGLALEPLFARRGIYIRVIYIDRIENAFLVVAVAHDRFLEAMRSGGSRRRPSIRTDRRCSQAPLRTHGLSVATRTPPSSIAHLPSRLSPREYLAQA